MPPLDSPFSGDSAFYRRAGWQLKFAWFPHRCDLSRQLIWLKFGYLGTAVYTGPDTPVREHYWHTKQEHLIWQLKNERFNSY